MTAYVIQSDIPVPPTRRGGNWIGPRTEWTRLLSLLEPGQSVMTEYHNDLKSAEQYIQRSKPKRFAIRKIPSQGWRVWRVE